MTSCSRAVSPSRTVALLRGWAEGLVGYSLQHGYDRTHGGFYYTGPLGKDADDTKKEWWVEAEALVSMLEMYRLTGKSEYYQVFCQTLDFVEKHQVAKEGSWWATCRADGSPQADQRTGPWQGAYHTSWWSVWELHGPTRGALIELVRRQSPPGASLDLLLATAASVFLFYIEWLQVRRPLLPAFAAWPIWTRWACYYAAAGVILLFGKFTAQQFIYFQF